MVDAEERLIQSQESKVKANERASEAVTRLEGLHENVENIFEEKSNLEKDSRLKNKNVNCCVQCRRKMQTTKFYRRKLTRKEKDKKLERKTTKEGK